MMRFDRTIGDHVKAGERFGIMKFGSRMDEFLPPSATVRATTGDMVRGGETIIAVLN
jgi:phosphatidylserine decarboxylase